MIINLDIETVNGDDFTEMPLSTQALYFHLICNANEENKLYNAKAITRSIRASNIDLDLLYDRSFIDDEQDDNGFTVTKILR